MKKMNKNIALILVFIFSFVLLNTNTTFSKAKLSKKELDEIIKIIDDRQENTGDYKVYCYIKQKERNKSEKAFQCLMLRRDKEDKFLFMIIKPKDEKGNAYLKVDKNLFFYDALTKKWSRRTDRERLSDTDTRRSDIDESRLSIEYNPTYIDTVKLGNFDAHIIKLQSKDNNDVAYPTVKLWIDTKTFNILKTQDYSLSGKLMRTSYYPKWSKKYSESKKDFVWFPSEIRIYDEIEKGNFTIILLKNPNFNSLKSNIFSKAWIESKTR